MKKYCHFTSLKRFLELLQWHFARVLSVNRAEIHKSQASFYTTLEIHFMCSRRDFIPSDMCSPSSSGAIQSTFWEFRAFPLQSQQCHPAVTMSSKDKKWEYHQRSKPCPWNQQSKKPPNSASFPQNEPLRKKKPQKVVFK